MRIEITQLPKIEGGDLETKSEYRKSEALATHCMYAGVWPANKKHCFAEAGT